MMRLNRHCERSDVSAVARRAKAEAIHRAALTEWIASSLSLLAMTIMSAMGSEIIVL
jgi:hypothetical protein